MRKYRGLCFEYVGLEVGIIFKVSIYFFYLVMIFENWREFFRRRLDFFLVCRSKCG